jgi:oxygen-independent coproporphyrinogen-3 oxidase
MDVLGSSQQAQCGSLAEKYASTGPRYTSYPTAPWFDEAVPMEEFRQHCAQATGDISLYLHVPFCRDICYYCSCNKTVTRDPSVSERYLDYLRREIDLQAQLHGSQRPVRQMHWGGGSPTFLDHAEITALMHHLATNFGLLDHGEREYSIEVDPRTVKPGTIALLKGLGFNRINLGIQDFDHLVQKSINRIQPFGQVAAVVEEIRRHGFRSLSFDLISGLPHQDQHTMSETLDKVVALKPDRIACYAYAHMPERFPSQRAIDRRSLPDATSRLNLQRMMGERLTDSGYLHIGLDHYVLPEDDLARAQQQGCLQRNFQGYSVQMTPDIASIGVSAISQVGDFYVQNERNIDSYYTRLQSGQLPLARARRLQPEDKLRRRIIMALICNLRLDLRALEDEFQLNFQTHFQTELQALHNMAQDGLLTITAHEIIVLEAGRPFLCNICMVFDQYLQ